MPVTTVLVPLVLVIRRSTDGVSVTDAVAVLLLGFESGSGNPLDELAPTT